MDVFLWLLIGLGAGVIVGLLSVDAHERTLSERGWARIGSLGAGAVGGVAGALVLRAFSNSARADVLTLAAGALAGGLWVSWLTEITVSRRRQGDDVQRAVDSTPADRPRRGDVPAYDATREALVAGLSEDAAAHDAGRYAEVGRQFAAIRDSVARQDPAGNGQLHVALRFWRGWMTARDERWREDGTMSAIRLPDWPRLARGIVSDLALDRVITDPIVNAQFAYAAPTLGAPTPGRVSDIAMASRGSEA